MDLKLIVSPNEQERIAALKESRLANLIPSEMLPKIIEAGAKLLTDPKLRECTPESILGAFYQAVTLDFRLDRVYGEVWLIPRKNKAGYVECQLQIGYKGWKAVALQTGLVAFLEMREVRQGDVFEYEFGSNSFLTHRPQQGNQQPATHYYAFARLNNGMSIFDVITAEQAEQNRRLSESQYEWNGKQKVFSLKPIDMWAKHYTPMALRRPIKNICAALPLKGREIENVIETDGTVTYLQKDGILTTITQAQVEDQAEKIEPGLKLSPEIQDKYYQVQDALGSMDNIKALIDYYTGFSESELKEHETFIELFFERAAAIATHQNDLMLFWTAAKRWQTNTKFTAILTKAKQRLQNAN